MDLLELKGVSKKLGSFRLQVDCEFEGITAVLGPSGCGKTTMLNIIAGLIRQDSGSIILNGRDISNLPPEKRRIGYVFQDYALFPHMTVRENLSYGNRGSVDEIAEISGITHLLDRSVRLLSGGEKQRVALARALITEPDLLLLDEPMSSVDELMRKRLIVEMGSILKNYRIPVVYVTHSRREAFLMADRIAVMLGGKILQIDEAEKVFEEPKNRHVAEFMGVENIYDGIVKSSGKYIEIEWSEGTVYSAKNSFQKGDEVVFCIRPEYVMVVREGKPLGEMLDGNVFHGSVIKRINVGGMHELLVKLENELVTSLIPDHAYHRLGLDEKDEVMIGFKKNRVHVMKRTD